MTFKLVAVLLYIGRPTLNILHSI